MNILTKILMPVLATAALGLAISTTLSYQMSMKTIESLTATSQKMAIANAIVELEAGLEFNIFNAISLAQTGLLLPYLSGNAIEQAANKKAVQERIVNMRNTYYYVMIGILNTKGIVVSHTESTFLGENLSRDAYFQEAMTGSVAIGNPFIYKGMVVYTVASPVFDLDTNEVIGVAYNVSRLIDTMSKRLHLGEKGTILVAGSNGMVFIHKDNDKVLVKNLLNFEWGHQMFRAQSGEIEFSLDGELKVAHYDTIHQAGWLAVAIADVAELKQPSTNIRNNITMLALVILLCLTGIIYIFINNIVKSLLKAIKYAEQVAGGDLDKDLESNYKTDGLFMSMFNSACSAFHKLLEKFSRKDNNKEEIHSDLQINEQMEFCKASNKDELIILYNALQVMVHSMRNMVEKSEAASKLKSEFLANMSHEIRTPLNAIIGLAYLYLERERDPVKKDDYVAKIQIAGRSLLGVINNVLDVSKIEAGMFQLENISFNLKETGMQLAIIHQETAKNKDILLSFDYEPTLPDFVIGDSVRLGQVLNNLIGNALKFTEQGYVRYSFSQYKDDQPDNSDIKDNNTIKILFEVKDTGLGIAEDLLEIMLQPFTQADASISRRFGGTGLGLSISDRIVALMGGKLTVVSEIGQGALFSFILEFARAEQGHSELASEFSMQPFYLKNKRILVVEDNEINQLLMEELLKGTGAEIVIAENGKIAVDLVKTDKFDLVLMDMQMPVMDGIQASKEIRKLYTFYNLPIVAVTANAMKEDKEQGFAVGLNDYLTKPIEPKQLMKVLETWLIRNNSIF